MPARCLERTYHPLLRRLRDSRLPIVTAMNGPAAGVGMSLALMGDLVIAARSAFFALGFTRLGLVPDGGATWLVPRLIGLARARELAILGDRLPAEKAHAWGMIHKVADDEIVMDEALVLAARLSHGPKALALTRKLFWESSSSQFRGTIEARAGCAERGRRHGGFPRRLGGFLRKARSAFQGRIERDLAAALCRRLRRSRIDAPSFSAPWAIAARPQRRHAPIPPIPPDRHRAGREVR